MRTTLVLALFAAWLAAAASATDMPVKVEETVLDNGMKVFAIRRPGLPQAACALAVRAGAVNEVPGYTGIAHFLEHMLFKGSDKIGVKDPALDARLRSECDRVAAQILQLEDEGADAKLLEEKVKERDGLFKAQQENLELNHIFRIYDEAGGAMTNAFTSEDMTVYFCLLPPQKMEVFFWVEAERFRRPVFRQFHSEKDVVREERRLGENRPGHAFHEELDRVIFGSHPYNHPVIGYHEDLRRLTREDMRRFFDTWYTPDNMFCIVAGDVEAADVFRLAAKYFGDWKAAGHKKPRIPVLPIPKAGPARVWGHGTGSPAISVTYRVPGGATPEEVNLEILALHLGDPEGSLRDGLVKEKGIATSVRASYDARRYGGVLTLRAEMKPGLAPEDAEGDMLAAVQRLVDAPLPAAEVSSLARRYRADLLGAFKNEMRLGFRFLFRENVGSWRDFPALVDRALAVTPAELQKTAAQYLVRDNRVVGIYANEAPAPAAAPAPPAEEPRAAPPEKEGIPATLEELEFKERAFEVPRAPEHLATLKNGVRVVCVPDAYDFVFRIRATLTGGSSEDPEGKEGLAELLAAVANRSGTPTHSRKALREKLEALVGEAGVSAGFSGLSLSLDTFQEDREGGLALFRDMLLNGLLDETAFAAEKARMKADLIEEDTRPRSLSSRTWRALLWGEINRTRRPTQDSLDAVTLADLKAALDAHRDPRRCVIAVSGNFDRKEMVDRLETLLGGWKAKDGPLPSLDPGTPAAQEKGLHLMDFDASQGYVSIGAATVPRTHGDFTALQALGQILAQRLFDRIRSNEGLAYQAGARLNPEWDLPSTFTMIFQTKARSVPFGIRLAMEEAGKLAEEGPTPEEMERAKKELATGLQVAFGRGEGVATTYADLVVLGVKDLDWYARHPDRVKALTADAVRRAAATYLDAKALAILCVGKTRDMEAGDGQHPDRMADFGTPTIHEAPVTLVEPRTPREVVLHLIRRIAQGDVEGMKPYVSEEYRARLSEPGAARQIKMQGRMLGQASYEVTSEEGDEERAEVRVRFEMTMGEQAVGLAMAFSLVREGEKWVCTEFKPVQ